MYRRLIEVTDDAALDGHYLHCVGPEPCLLFLLMPDFSSEVDDSSDIADAEAIGGAGRGLLDKTRPAGPYGSRIAPHLAVPMVLKRCSPRIAKYEKDGSRCSTCLERDTNTTMFTNSSGNPTGCGLLRTWNDPLTTRLVFPLLRLSPQVERLKRYSRKVIKVNVRYWSTFTARNPSVAYLRS